jgi:acyl-CoA reductase-like NAD-dependent aldehyde dehydrogenase
MIEVKNLIGGEFSPAQAKIWLERDSPLTGKPCVRVPDSGVLDVVKAIQAAHQAWPSWSRLASEARAQLCIAVADRLRERAQELSLATCEESGVTIGEAHRSVAQAIATFQFLGEHGLGLVKDTGTRFVGLQRTLNLLPFGLVGIICPAYDPVMTLGARVGAALCAGNVVVAKASSYSPRTAHIFAECIQRSGLPSGVFNLVQGRGESVGQTIAQHPGVAALAFAGQTSTGLALHQLGAELLKRIQLSLSTSNPVLIFEGVNIEKTAADVARLSLSGEVPLHLRGMRILVQESIRTAFVDAFLSEAESLSRKIGDPRQEETRLGPLARKKDQNHFLSKIDQVVVDGGKIIFGGQQKSAALSTKFEEGNFVTPTIITDLSPCSKLFQDEVIGPITLLRYFKYAHDAVKFANSSPFGEAAYLFHADPLQAQAIASRIEAGRIFVNAEYPQWDFQLGFGGVKMSGLGRESGLDLMLFFSRQTVISTRI